VIEPVQLSVGDDDLLHDVVGHQPEQTVEGSIR
jgi:hypothetical protein